MPPKEAARHHFVPRFLLRPWLKEDPQGQRNLWGYFWDPRTDSLRRKRRGVASFCGQLDLLTLRGHALGRDAIEREFFGSIDAKGAEARDRLLKDGPHAFDSSQRSDFARLLLSLDVRRPIVIRRLREDVAAELAIGLDSDPDIRAAMANIGISGTASSYLARHAGDTYLSDAAVSMVQQLTDNPLIGGRLINSFWHVVRLEDVDESLVLSDRPLVRLRGYDQPGAAWLLPLTPKAAFVAVNHRGNLDRIRQASRNGFARKLNVASAQQTERFLFSVDPRQEHWIGKHISR